MLYEKDLTGKVLVQKLSELYEKRQYYIDNMMKARIDKGIDEVIQIIERVTLNSSNRKHYAYTKKAPQ
jgi:UDP-N-acetylglucosamine--N-acetylmuramyl-(pentapeptide) pyrophosphoryl-undecaprenol N-acetylglucosamine transferase